MRDKERIVRRIIACLRTSEDSAASDTEREVALRKANEWMIAHNLSRDDVTITDDVLDVSRVEYGRYRAFSYGSKSCQWQNALGWFIENLFGTIKHYVVKGEEKDTLVNKLSKIPKDFGTAIYFYGPDEDAESAAEMFTELQEAIATTATMKFNSYDRKSGASYAEGFVQGLNSSNSLARKSLLESDHETTALAIRSNALSLKLKGRCKTYLESVHGVKVSKGGRSKGRSGQDYKARQEGISHGKKYQVEKQVKKKLG